MIAVVAPRDNDHQACLAVARTVEPPLVSTWPCFTEAMFVARRDLGLRGQRSLLRMIERESLLLVDVDREGCSRVAALMEKYGDVPMSLADATLVVTAERLRQDTVFTLDSHFEVYRLNDRKPIKLLP
ncbi:MAG: hypothetical protein NVSMB17_13490 [Candidatus Dormibacteria bacterium]